MASTAAKRARADLLAHYSTYDEHVDVVSAFEWLFTEVPDFAATVAHFERYPRIKVSDTGSPLTPDFTVVFNDGTGLVGEAAQVARHPNSLDKLCGQIGNYAALTHLPGPDDQLQPVREVDVLLLLQVKDALEALQGIIERRCDFGHPYKSPLPPCVVQYTRETTGDDAFYTFQRIPDPLNGVLRPGERPADLGAAMQGKNVNVSVSRFSPIKVRRAFNNDQIDPLYLATHLHARTWPTQFGASLDRVTVTPADVAQRLRTEYGVGRAADVRAALELLAAAGLAKGNRGTWTVSLKQLGRGQNRDPHEIIADRATTTASRRGTAPIRRAARGRAADIPNQGQLF